MALKLVIFSFKITPNLPKSKDPVISNYSYSEIRKRRQLNVKTRATIWARETDIHTIFCPRNSHTSGKKRGYLLN